MKMQSYVLILAIAVFASLPANGQAVSWLNKGTVEGAVFGGFTSGLGQTGGGVGGNIGVAANQWILPYGEVTYFPSLSNTARFSPSGLTFADAKLSYTDVQGGVHIRAPNVFGNPKVMPYASIGAGVLHNGSLTGNVSGTVNGSPYNSTYTVSSENNFAVSFGGGIRYYTKNKVGFRVEVQGFKPTGSKYGNDPFVKVTVGVFFYANNK